MRTTAGSEARVDGGRIGRCRRLLAAAAAVGLAATGVVLVGVQPASAAAYVWATNTAVLQVDADDSASVTPGDTLRYSVSVGNFGDATTNAVLDDALGEGSTLVDGSVQATPIARNDSGYSTVGNVPVSVPSGSGVLVNDSDPDGTAGLIVLGSSATSAQGGQVLLAADGSFTYNPPAGYSGQDTFTYTVGDGEANTDSATVSVSVGTPVWFIDGDATSPGDGRYGTPFSTTTRFNSVAADEAGDLIYVHEAAAAYSDGIQLLAGQQLVGAGSALTVAPNLSLAESSTQPVIRFVDLAANNTLRGFDIVGATNARTLVQSANAGAGALVVDDVSVTNTAGNAVHVYSTSAIDVTFTSISSTTASGPVSVTAAGGSFAVLGGTITTTGGSAIRVVNNPNAAVLELLDVTVQDATLTGQYAGVDLAAFSPGFGTVNITGNTITTTFAYGVSANVHNVELLDVSHNTISSPHFNVIIEGQGSGVVGFDIHDNTLNGPTQGIYVRGSSDGSNTAEPTIQGRVRNNTIVLDPTQQGSSGIEAELTRPGLLAVDIDSNTITGYSSRAIAVYGYHSVVTEHTTTVHATVTDNVATTTAGIGWGLDLIVQGTESPKLLCANVAGNDLASGTNPGYPDYSAREHAVGQLQIEGLTPSPASGAQLQAFLVGTDVNPAGKTAYTEGSAFTSGTCQLPQLPDDIEAEATTAAAVQAAPGASPEIDRFAAVESLVASSFPLALDTLDPNQQVVVRFDVVIDAAFTGQQVCNQATVTGDGGIEVRTDDPATAATADPTCTTVQQPDESAPDTTVESGPPTPTNETTAGFTFSGTDPGGSVAGFECRVGDDEFEVCASPHSLSGLGDGLTSFEVRAVDGAGNVDDTPASYGWLIDTSEPDTSIGSGPADPTTATSAAFTFSSTDTGSEGVTNHCRLDDADPEVCSSPWSYSGLAPGEHTFEVWGTDAAGNAEQSPATQTWTITAVTPNRPPTFTVAGGECSATDRSQGTVRLAVSDPDGDPVTLALVSISNALLVPSANVTIGGTATQPTVTVTAVAGRSGRSTLGIEVRDGTATVAFTMVVIVGTDGANSLGGTAGTDLVLGRDGDDSPTGNGADDVLCGGAGVDTLTGGGGNDTLEGGTGNDTLRGNAGDDTADGGIGNDRIEGAAGNDTLQGGDGNDTILGAVGNDSLLGGAGTDTLTGGTGRDAFDGGTGMDTVTDFRPAQGDTRTNIP